MLSLQADSQQQQEAIGAAMAGAAGERGLIFLHGDLGAGKTTLVRGFLRGLGYAGKVKSPTYTLMEPYQIGARRVCHMDLYRMADPGELEYLGLRDLLAEPTLILVEWPQHGEGELPEPDLTVEISYRGEGRLLCLEARSRVGQALLNVLRK